MLLDTLTQAKQQIEKSQSFLIIFKNDLTGDTLCAALALAETFAKAGKRAQLVSGDSISDKFSFLPETHLIQNSLTDEEGTLVFEIKNGRSKINELWYDEASQDLKVFIAPKPGTSFRKIDVSIAVEGRNLDLILCVGVPAPESTGSIFEKQAALFFQTPIINIDVSSANEGYGSINLIDLTASSNSELVFDLLRFLGYVDLDTGVATALLAGLVAKTDSFQSLKTTPRSLFAASKLLELGADHQEIVRNLYKTKTFGLLKLWGRALSKLTMYAQHQAVVSSLSGADLAESKASHLEVEQVLEELASTLSDARVILLLAETEPRQISGYIFAKPQLNLEELLLDLKASRSKGGLSSFRMKNVELEEAQKIAEKTLLDWLKSIEQV